MSVLNKYTGGNSLSLATSSTSSAGIYSCPYDSTTQTSTIAGFTRSATTAYEEFLKETEVEIGEAAKVISGLNYVP